MPVENNGTLQKWHVTNASPEIDKYGTHKNGALNENGTSCKKILKGYICHGLSWVIFKREFLNLLYDSE